MFSVYIKKIVSILQLNIYYLFRLYIIIGVERTCTILYFLFPNEIKNYLNDRLDILLYAKLFVFYMNNMKYLTDMLNDYTCIYN